MDSEFDTGFGAMAALGYDFGKARIETEIGYRTNDIDQFSALGVNVVGGGDMPKTATNKILKRRLREIYGKPAPNGHAA
ncbi:hypothetical protein ACFLZM_04430 [Thermodesulfobacteriota bacterium]